MQVNTIEAPLRYCYAQSIVSRLVVEHLNEVSFEPFFSAELDGLVLKLIGVVAGETIHDIRYPKDWWQAFKERWFPVWLLARYPVTYEEWRLEMHYPSIQIRERMGGKIRFYHHTSPGFAKPLEEDVA